MDHLTDSVGLAGVNRPRDVRRVQERLSITGDYKGRLDGRCGPQTIDAILKFQHFLRMPDGRVDSRGPTWRRLQAIQIIRPPVVKPAHGDTHPSRSAPHPNSPPTKLTGGTRRYTQPMPLPPRETINRGLQSPTNAFMLSKFGEPRSSYSQECRPPTHPKLISATDRIQFGRTTVSGIRPAIASLRLIIADIMREQPDVYKHLGSAGMMCCRYQRGSNQAITNHSWGTAIDVSVDGVPQPYGQRSVWLGLLLIGPIFNRHGWYWGAGYKRKTDSHHFECGVGLLNTFRL